MFLTILETDTGSSSEEWLVRHDWCTRINVHVWCDVRRVLDLIARCANYSVRRGWVCDDVHVGSLISAPCGAVSLPRSRSVVKNAALQCNYLNPGNVSVTRNRLCTELCTGMGDMSKTRLSECVGRTL